MAGTGEPHVLLLTGPPGVGKTTVLCRAAAALPEMPVRGFFTREIRESGRRVGFRIETFDGRSAVFAHENVTSPHRVSRYGVELAALDPFLEELVPATSDGVTLVDEIGKMESLSVRFVTTMTELLDGPGVLVATVALRAEGFPAAVKRRSDARLWTVTRANRAELPARVADWARAAHRP